MARDGNRRVTDAVRFVAVDLPVQGYTVRASVEDAALFTVDVGGSAKAASCGSS